MHVVRGAQFSNLDDEVRQILVFFRRQRPLVVRLGLDVLALALLYELS